MADRHPTMETLNYTTSIYRINKSLKDTLYNSHTIRQFACKAFIYKVSHIHNLTIFC